MIWHSCSQEWRGDVIGGRELLEEGVKSVSRSENARIQLMPNILAGATFRQWFAMLRDNRFAVDIPFWPRAALLTATSLFNSAAGLCENIVFRRSADRTRIEPPVFVLGVWRSGTTLLQNLLCVDRRFAYANYYQVLYPNTFLCTERYLRGFVEHCMPNTRFQDNMPVSCSEPAEDEVATCMLARRSMLMSWVFFRNQAYYDRLLTFRNASKSEIAEWQAALLLFVKKLTLKYRRPLVLKSPGHTGRIRLLLELFPSAKFVHIFRNPYDVYQSSDHTLRKIAPLMALQRPEFSNIQHRNIRQYAELCDAFFDERDLIPDGNLHEVRFEDLEKEPLAEMAKLYECLGLPPFDEVREDLAEYVQGLRGYERNRFSDLPDGLKDRIAREWRRSFEEWGYDSAGGVTMTKSR